MITNQNKEELRETRKQWFSQMEQKLQEMHTKEDDSLFYYHASEDRIVLSHAMFWTMTQLQFFKSKIRKRWQEVAGDRSVTRVTRVSDTRTGIRVSV